MYATRHDLEQRPFRTRLFTARAVGAVVVSAGISLAVSPVAGATGYETGGQSGAITGAGGGPTLGVGGPSSYTGGSTANNHQAAMATLGVGGPSSYTGGSTANNHPGANATVGVGDVNSYTGGGTPGTPQNGTNATTRTGNYGPGR